MPSFASMVQKQSVKLEEEKIDFEFSIADVERAAENRDLPPIVTENGTVREQLEIAPRQTLIKMLQTSAYDVNFTFKCRRGCGQAYIQAMRQHLSRGRKYAQKNGKQLSEFKLIVVGVQTYGHYDLVTLVRTTHTSRIAKSVYDDILNLVSTEVGND